MRPATIGTAGHIDHGKSALVRALTGIDPDRLAEEQRRGMTLDLGFAHLDLPGGQRVGIVDVPGHEALIHNMLAGAGGLDLVMLVVAADEGVMPQTREHLDIVRFLPIGGGVIVLTKVDLVDDDAWLAAVEEEVRSLTAGTVLAGAPIVRVSAKTGVGIADLMAALDRVVAAVPDRPAGGAARLPIDRSFTIQGFGTVVTGTLWSGTIAAGDALQIVPQGRDVRVRGVQVHGQSVATAPAGSRVAVNLAGVDKDEVRRGDVLATPGAFTATDRLDVRLRMLPSVPAVGHAARVHVHVGAGEAIARVAMVDRPRLAPGDEALVQLRLDRPIVAVHGDRFVVRRYSPTQTLGGGVVVQASPPRRRKGAAAAALQTVEQTGPEALVIAAVAARGAAGMPVPEVASAAGLDASAVGAAIAAARAGRSVTALGDRLFAAAVIDAAEHKIVETLAAYHKHTPWRSGMPRDELKGRVASGPAGRLFDHVMGLLKAREAVVERGGLVALSGHAPQIDDASQRLRAGLAAAFDRAGTSPPAAEQLREAGDAVAVERMLQTLMDERMILQVAPDVRFSAKTVEGVRRTIVEMARAGQDVTVASLRDRLQTNRKFALALLEYFDRIKVTRRVGDRRVLGPQADDGV
jgi:selenocysteine-specific elongation factor